MSKYNHRILATQYKDEIDFTIHEVYYDDNGIPNGYTESGVPVSSDSIEGIKWVLERMTECVNKPILWSQDRFPEVYKEI
jgi:hypothetical protein